MIPALFLRTARRFHHLPAIARREVLRDHFRGPARNNDDAHAVTAAVVRWLCEAQDNSASKDGGFARDYSLISGWATSYPETTGYIIPTLLEIGEGSGRPELVDRAVRALDWLVSIQFPEGGFQGGKIDATPRVPVTFNTGQILLGLAAGAARWPERYQGPMLSAARWLRNTQDSDGAWRKHSTPFAAQGDKSYETHVAWGLLEAARLVPAEGFGEAGLANIRWAISRQQENGWFADCCLEDPEAPLTHTIGYALRGVIAGWHFSGSQELLSAALRTAHALRGVMRRDGSIPGRLDANWQAAVPWICLTGNVQIAACWALLADAQGARPGLREAAELATGFVRRTIDVAGVNGPSGGVKGCIPVDGGYGRLQYLNWAAKFYLDAELALAHPERFHG